MTREEAYEFLKLYKKFQKTGLKVYDHAKEDTEILFPNDDRKWYDDWAASKVIEANS